MQDTGIITFSVCNVHQAEDSSSEMLTQGLLGMKAIILERRKWIKIKLENDENEGWVHPRAIASLFSMRFRSCLRKSLTTSQRNRCFL